MIFSSEKFINLTFGFIYLVLFQYIFENYLAVVFNYAYYYYIDRELSLYFYMYFISLLPVFFRCPSKSITTFSFDLIYVLGYLPSQATILYMWTDTIQMYYFTSVLFCVSMVLFSLSTNVTFSSYAERQIPGRLFSIVIGAITVIGLIAIFYYFGSFMRIVDFSEVYDLRKASSSVQVSGFVGYIVMWLTALSLPYYFSMALTKKSLTMLLFALIVSISLYAANGAKVAILNGLIIFSLYFIVKIRGDFLFKILFCSVAVFFVVIILPDDGLALWVKSIFMVRVYSNSGWMMVMYYDYFSEFGYTYFSHINIVNKFLDNYPYGDLALGQVIGIKVSGNTEANFNAIFFASDGIAAVGPVGIVLVTLAFIFFLFLLDVVSKKIERVFLFMFLSGFLMTLLNVSLSTSLLSGGGLLIFMLLCLNGYFRSPSPSSLKRVRD